MADLEQELFAGKPQLRTVRREDVPRIHAATSAEGAEMIAPTHVLERGGVVVGYGSVGKLGVIAGWTSQTVDDETSARALVAMENAAKLAGVEVLVVACTADCRFKPLMAAAGYVAGADAVTLFYKKAR